MFNFLKKNKNTPFNFSALHTDMHSHLIPGIDDGAPDLETSISLIKGMVQLGYKRIITTPHVMADLYPNKSTDILKGRDDVRAALKAEGISIEFDAAAEYLLDEGFEAKLDAKDLLTMGKNYLLVELSFVSPPRNLEALLFKLQIKGYRPILAHPERYMYYHNDKNRFAELKEKGCLLQLNLLSLSGYYGNAVKSVALRLLKAGMVDFLGSDLHHEQHLKQLQSLNTLPAKAHDFKMQNQL